MEGIYATLKSVSVGGGEGEMKQRDKGKKQTASNLSLIN